MNDPLSIIQSSISTPGAIAGASSTGPAASALPPVGKDFKTLLMDSLDEVNRLQSEADQGVQRLMSGETDNVAEVFTAANKAGIAFSLLMEVRNKLLDAYRDIQQIRV
jgi:flagellar hook-basal body complex protein FliE